MSKQSSTTSTTSNQAEKINYNLPLRTDEFVKVLSECNAEKITTTSRGGNRVGDIVFEKMKQPKSGGMHSSYVNIAMSDSYSKSFMVQSPWLHCQFGGPREPAEEYRDPTNKKFTMDLSFRDMDSDADVKQFYDAMNMFDALVLDMAAKGVFKTKKSSSTDPAVLREFYTPVVRQARDKATGEVTDRYPPSLKLKVPFYGSDAKNPGFQCAAKNTEGQVWEKYSDQANIVPKGSKVRVLVKPVQIWANAMGGFGCSWQIQMFDFAPNMDANILECAFRDDAKAQKQLQNMKTLSLKTDEVDADADDDAEGVSGGDGGGVDDEDDDEVVSDDDEVHSD